MGNLKVTVTCISECGILEVAISKRNRQIIAEKVVWMDAGRKAR